MNLTSFSKSTPNLKKKYLRKKYLKKRNLIYASLSKDEITQYQKQIKNHLEKILTLIEYQSIMFYYPYGSEIGLLSFSQELLLANKTVLFPKVISPSKIIAVKVDNLEDFEKGYKDIMEPNSKNSNYQEKIDIVLVPGISFSLINKDHEVKFARIGYGGGFYDRFFLEHQEIFKVGIFFDFQKTKDVFLENHDALLDRVVTEEKSYVY